MTYKTGEIVAEKEEHNYVIFNKGEYRDCTIQVVELKTNRKGEPTEGMLKAFDSEYGTSTTIFIDFVGKMCKTKEDAAKRKNYSERIMNKVVLMQYEGQSFPGYKALVGKKMEAVALYTEPYEQDSKCDEYGNWTLGGTFNQVDWIGTSVEDIDKQIAKAQKKREKYKAKVETEINIKSTPDYEQLTPAEKLAVRRAERRKLRESLRRTY